jgi:hypothetical protein
MARGRGLNGYGDPFNQLGGGKISSEQEEQKKENENPSDVDGKEKEPQHQAEDQHEERKEETAAPTNISSSLSKYKKRPKYETHVAHNVRIPKQMRKDMENIAKKLGVPLRKNTGFFQEFTVDALRVAIENAKKELGID